MFIVKRVRFKNFRSYGNQFTEVDLIRNKTTVVTATNGAGKSSILMAIEFGLFGKVSSGIPKPDLVNTINKKDCLVEVECESLGRQIMVRRGIKPAIFEVTIDGKLVDQDAAVRDYQKRFEEDVLGFNLNSFRQIVSVSGGSYTPFLLQTAGQRRQIVEELLSLTVFSQMSLLHTANVNRTKEDLTDAESEINRLSASLKSLHRGLKAVQEQDESHRQQIESIINDLEVRAKTLTEERQKLTNENDSLLEHVKAHKANEKKLEQLKTYQKDIKKKQATIEKTVSFFSDNDHCPTCKQAITEAFRKASIEPLAEKRATMDRALSDLVKKVDEINSQLEETATVLDVIAANQKRIHANEAQVSELQRQIKAQRKQLSTSANVEEIQTEITKAEASLELMQNRRLALLEEKQYNDVVAAIIKDGGIKGRIIDQYVPHMNNEINRYLQIMGLDISFTMDNQFRESIKSRYNDELSYSSFSAGERARIDIAILFTWRALARLKSSLSCNLLALDELFDSALDAVGLEAFIDLLRYHLPDNNVFLITHRPEVVDKFESNLRIEKQGNFSRIV